LSSHISIYATLREYNVAKEMSPNSSNKSGGKKSLKIERIANSLNVVIQAVNQKEADKPLYLLRYDD
jgi:hypothetical protein